MKNFLVFIFGLLVLFLIWFHASFIGRSEFKEYKIGDYSEYNEIQYIWTGGYAFIWKKESKYYLVENGVQKQWFNFLSWLIYSPDGKRWMAVWWNVNQGCYQSLIIDWEISDISYRHCDEDLSSLKKESLYSFSPDSKRIAYVKPVWIDDQKGFRKKAEIISIDGKDIHEFSDIEQKDQYGQRFLPDSKDVYDEIREIFFTPDSKDIFYTWIMWEGMQKWYYPEESSIKSKNETGVYLLKNSLVTISKEDAKIYELLSEQFWKELFQPDDYRDNSKLYSSYRISKFFLKTGNSDISLNGKSLIGSVSDTILGTRIRVVGWAIDNASEISFQLGLILFIKENVIILSVLIILIIIVAFNLTLVTMARELIVYAVSIITLIFTLWFLYWLLLQIPESTRDFIFSFQFLWIFFVIIIAYIWIREGRSNSPPASNFPMTSIETEEERGKRKKKEEAHRKLEEQKKQKAILERRRKLLPKNYLDKFLQHAEIKYGRKDKYGNQNTDSFEKEIKEYLIMITKQDTDKSVKNSVDAYIRGRNYPALNEDYKWLISTLRLEFIEHHEKKEQKLLSGELVNFASMSGIEFERYISRTLEKKGYQVDLTPESWDQWADIIARKNDKVIVIQAKNYSKPVWNKAVQEVIGAIKYYDGTEWWVITNSTFTSSAKDLARVNGIILMEWFEWNQIENW